MKSYLPVGRSDQTYRLPRKITGLSSWIPPGASAHDATMGYEVTTDDGSCEVVADADTYQLEGPLTTFFRTEAGRPVVDSWSVRVASFQTADIVRIRRLGERELRAA